MSMDVVVEIMLDKKPNKKFYQEMLNAAKCLTDAKNSIKIHNEGKAFIAEFTIKKCAHYKCVDKISEEFKFTLCMYDYDDLTISFP